MESGKQGGIQLLLAAEQESQSIVNASKNANVKRLEIETEEKTNTLTSESSRISTEVVQMLMRHVLSVKT
ncbi:hypothetical protein MKX01_039972 [Papaver californicum]|nr:hypothetical protein MKX01_039972 [Papaver californicum]